MPLNAVDRKNRHWLVLDATDREGFALVEVLQASVLEFVAQKHIVSLFVRLVLSATPEVGFDAIILGSAIAGPSASRERKKTIEVRTIAVNTIMVGTIPVTGPASPRLKNLASNTFPAYCGKQNVPFRSIGQVPAFRTRTNSSSPLVKLPILGAVLGRIFVTET